MRFSRFDYYVRRKREHCVRCRKPLGRNEYAYCDYDTDARFMVYDPIMGITETDCPTNPIRRHLCLNCDNEMDYDYYSFKRYQEWDQEHPDLL